MRSIKTVLRLCSAVVIGLFLAVVGFQGQAKALSSQNMLALINGQRRSAGLVPFSLNSRLNASAYAKAQDICTHDYWAHTSPSGLTPWYFMGRAGYPYIAAAENMAEGYSSDSSVVAAWLASPGHRANILSSQFRDFGAGYLTCNLQGRQTVVIVAHFGAQAAAQSTQKPAAPAPKPAQVTQVTQKATVVQQISKPAATPRVKTAVKTKVTKRKANAQSKTSVRPQRETNKHGQLVKLLLLQLKTKSRQLFQTD